MSLEIVNGVLLEFIPEQGRNEIECEDGVAVLEFYQTQVKIPDGVVEIADQAFKNCKRLERVELPSTLQKIGERAFENCIALVNVDIPDSVLSLGEGAFMGCRALNGVKISKNVRKIPPFCFYKCYKLKSVVMGEDVSEISENAFSNCRAFRRIHLSDGGEGLPYSIEEIGNAAFQNCVELCLPPLPDTLLYIGKSAFENCNMLKIERLPPNLKIIEELSFSGTVGAFKDRTLEIPEGVVEIRERAFMHCIHIDHVKIPASVEKISREAFLAIFLVSATLEEGVRIIEDKVFYSSNIAIATLPESVRSIGEDVFGSSKYINPCLKVIAIDGSLAHKYAIQRNIRVELKK